MHGLWAKFNMYVHKYICMYVHTHTYTQIYIHIYIYTVYIYIYVYIYVCVCVCVCVSEGSDQAYARHKTCLCTSLAVRMLREQNSSF